MARSYDSRQFPAGPFVEPRVTPTHRGLKRLGAIGEIVPGDDIEVARAIARIQHPRQKVPPIVYRIILTGHRTADDPPEVTTDDDPMVVLTCTEDQAIWQLYKVELDISRVSTSGDIEVQLRHMVPDDVMADGDGEDMLAEPIIIDEGTLHSDDSATPYEIDLTKNVVEWKDRVAIECVQAGTGARGLTIGLWFSR